MPARLITDIFSLYRAFDSQVGTEVSPDLHLLGRPGREHHTFARDYASALHPEPRQPVTTLVRSR